MMIPGLHLSFTTNLSMYILIFLSLLAMVTSAPSAISNVIDDGVKSEHQMWPEQQRLSERGEPPVDAFARPTSFVQVPSIHAPQKRDERDCLGIYLCTKEDWKGDCYWACFRKGLEVALQLDWAREIKSARPDHGTKCKFFFGTECRTRHKSQDMVYPGGDFDAKNLGKIGVGCFYCM
ncbi:hypothetical protein LY78DRAFT_746481 [Colletotrichum sublineola]|nr:hypothetical protein LY78DRAFT_746481 [Colletotrichum sublineola]